MDGQSWIIAKVGISKCQYSTIPCSVLVKPVIVVGCSALPCRCSKEISRWHVSKIGCGMFCAGRRMFADSSNLLVNWRLPQNLDGWSPHGCGVVSCCVIIKAFHVTYSERNNTPKTFSREISRESDLVLSHVLFSSQTVLSAIGLSPLTSGDGLSCLVLVSCRLALSHRTSVFSCLTSRNGLHLRYLIIVSIRLISNRS